MQGKHIFGNYINDKIHKNIGGDMIKNSFSNEGKSNIFLVV